MFLTHSLRNDLLMPKELKNVLLKLNVNKINTLDLKKNSWFCFMRYFEYSRGTSTEPYF